MAVSDELGSFVKEALARGASREQVEDVLLRAGWTAQQVRAALAGYAADHYPVVIDLYTTDHPVPAAAPLPATETDRPSPAGAAPSVPPK